MTAEYKQGTKQGVAEPWAGSIAPECGRREALRLRASSYGSPAAAPVWAAPESQTSPAQCKWPPSSLQPGQLLNWALAGLCWLPSVVSNPQTSKCEGGTSKSSRQEEITDPGLGVQICLEV